MDSIGIEGKFYKPVLFKRAELGNKTPCEICDLYGNYDACNSVACFLLRDNEGVEFIYKKQF